MARHELERAVIGVRARRFTCTAAVVVAALPLLGCQAVLGIRDPVVSGVGPDGTSGPDAAFPDAPVNRADGAVGDADGGARNPDAPRDAGSYGIPASRTRQAMAYDGGRGRLVVFGGANSVGQRLGDTWEWDGIGWTDVTPPSGSPPAREDAMMAYDATAGKVVLFGGYNSSGAFGDTWEWDGTSWTNVTPAAGSPPPRLAGGMAFDAGCGCVLLFGGAAGTNYLGDTWKWDGASESWTELTSSQDPSARDAFSMAYDSKDQAVLLFGGQNGTDQGDTWEWNGAGWSQQQPATSPAPGTRYPMAYDTNRDRAVLFGAAMNAGNVEPGHTWEWDGATWTDVTPPSGSPPQGDYAMAYDTALARTLMYAGGKDVYAWDGTSWSTL